MLEFLVRRPVWPALLVTLVIGSLGLSMPLMLDDYWHYVGYERFLSEDPLVSAAAARDGFGWPSTFNFASPPGTQAQGLFSHGDLAWWSSPQLHIEFWRPLSTVLGLADAALMGRSSAFAHAHGMVWSCGVIASAGLLLRRHLHPKLLALTLLLFALDDSHWWSRYWIANRSASIATTFAFVACWAHVRWHEQRRVGHLSISLLAAAGALAASESGLSGLAYLAAFPLAQIWGPRGSQGRRAHGLSSIPVLGVVAGWALLYTHSGAGSAGSAYYVNPPTTRRRSSAWRPATCSGSSASCSGSSPARSGSSPALDPCSWGRAWSRWGAWPGSCPGCIASCPTTSGAASGGSASRECWGSCPRSGRSPAVGCSWPPRWPPATSSRCCCGPAGGHGVGAW